MLINKLFDYAYVLSFFKLKFQIKSMQLLEYILQCSWKQQFTQNLSEIQTPTGLRYLLYLFNFFNLRHIFIVDNL